MLHSEKSCRVVFAPSADCGVQESPGNGDARHGRALLSGQLKRESRVGADLITAQRC